MGRVYIIKRVQSETTPTLTALAKVANVDGTRANVLTPGAESWHAEHRRDGRDHLQSNGTQWWIVGTITGTLPPRSCPRRRLAPPPVSLKIVTLSTSRLPWGTGRTLRRGRPGLGTSNRLMILTGELSTKRDDAHAVHIQSTRTTATATDANSLRVTGKKPSRSSITVLITGLDPSDPSTSAPSTRSSVARKQRRSTRATDHRDPEAGRYNPVAAVDDRRNIRDETKLVPLPSSFGPRRLLDFEPRTVNREEN